MKQRLSSLAACLAVACILPAFTLAQDHGGGGGGGCGDVFGDLIHVQRYVDEDGVATGQPILQKRWVEMPAELPGYGWGYCVIALDAAGHELPFADLSCDVAVDHVDQVVEVDYFGRLNGGRTKERNNRMHFNEIISTIKAAEMVHQEATGRLMLGYSCTYHPTSGRPLTCAEWDVVDSPMESMGLYTRLMKYGHLQTDPLEVDPWPHGDPARPTQYQPALTPEDYGKFHSSLWHLLPGFSPGSSMPDPWACFDDADGNGAYDPWEPYTDAEPFNGEYDLGELFTDIDGDGVRDGGPDTFNPLCAAPESLDSRDFTRAGAFVGGAASKTGTITRDLVQYLNRILKIPRKTEHTVAAPDTLPALVRECAVDPAWVEDPDAEDQTEPPYDLDDCDLYEADDTIVNYIHFPDVQERFVDFSWAAYERQDWRDEDVPVIRPNGIEGYWVEDQVSLQGWLGHINGPWSGEVENIDAFVEGARDALRSIEFIHNYAIPADLGWDFSDPES